MIEKLTVKGFRILQDFEWCPKAGLNILVGANSAGKSTVLDAIELVTRGSLHGQSARYALSPDWFNKADVDAFFALVAASPTSIPAAPVIEIAVTFSTDAGLAGLMGMNGPDGVNATGLLLTYAVKQDLYTQFIAEVRAMLSSASGAGVIPVEYYECTWKSFKGEVLIRKPKGVKCSRVDADPEPYSRAVDSYARNVVNGELADEKLREVTSAFRNIALAVDRDVLAPIVIPSGSRPSLGLQLDKSSRTDWKNSIVLHREGLPLAVLGSAEQTITKCSVALTGTDAASILLLEEPECHLSHTTLNELITIVDGAAQEGRQVFVATHSPFVLNRLGIDKLAIMASGKSPAGIGMLSSDTVRYFKKLSGYDTLRIVLAAKAVLVEGPTDEMVFDWAFHKLRGCYPQDEGIDVIECGTQHRRLLELAAALNKEDIVALRDNDGKPESHWLEKARPYLSDGRRYICGYEEEGRTIEPQVIYANRGNLGQLGTAVGYEGDIDELENHMLDNKTDWALTLLENYELKGDELNVPRYISEAVDFICPKAGADDE